MPPTHVNTPAILYEKNRPHSPPWGVRTDSDRLIADFVKFTEEESIRFSLPILTEEMVVKALNQSVSYFDNSSALSENTSQFVKEFILNGYKQIFMRSRLPVKKPIEANRAL